MEALLPHVIPLSESQLTRSAEAYNACSPRAFASSARTNALLTETNLSLAKSYYLRRLQRSTDYFVKMLKEQHVLLKENL